MKKIVISLALVLILCFSLFLISCGDTHTGCTHEYDNTNCDTKCNLCGKPYHNGHELVTPSIEGCQVPSYCTRCDYQTCEELIIEHLFVDENGNTLEKCARCNALNPNAPEQKPDPTPEPEPDPTPEPEPEPEPKPEPEPEVSTIYTSTFQFNYAYYDATETTTGEPLAVLLCDHSKFGYGFETFDIPDNIVAGDTITITHTGDITILESYPGQMCLYDGEVFFYSLSHADIVPISKENLTEEMLNEYGLQNNYVILDRTGKYTTLDKYTGETVYLVEDQQRVRPRTEDTPFYVACMLAYDPRDTETYEFYTGFKSPDIENKLITTYADFIELFDLTDEKNKEIRQITEQTFENNYVLYSIIGTGDCLEWIEIDKARIIDGYIHCNIYSYYYSGKLYCNVSRVAPYLIIIPKSELKELQKENEFRYTNIHIIVKEEG